MRGRSTKPETEKHNEDNGREEAHHLSGQEIVDRVRARLARERGETPPEIHLPEPGEKPPGPEDKAFATMDAEVQRLVTEAAREGLSPEAYRYQRPNFRYGVANGVLFSAGDALGSPGIVIPWIISRLSTSNLLIGLAPAISTAGSLLPQLFIASRVQHLPRKMPWYAGIGYVRSGAIGCIALAMLLLSGHPELLLPVFFSFYAIYSLGNGVSGVPWMEIVGKTVPPRRRGQFFGMRSFWGSLVALAMSSVVSFFLAQGTIVGGPLAFPKNVALLFALTATFYTLGVWAWTQIREPTERAIGQRTTLFAAIKLGPQIIRNDRNYRSFLSVRMLMTLAAISDPFYVVFAQKRLGAPAETVGIFIAASTIAGLVSNLIWSPLPNKLNPRALMMLRVVAGLMVPTAALVVPPLLSAAGLLQPGQEGPGTSLFAIVFALSGFAGGGANIVNNNMLLEIAPPAQRPLYVGFMNTILGFGTLVPITGGTLIDHFGFEPVFALSVTICLLGLLVARGVSPQRNMGN